jgi:hypothetical protein
VRLHHTICAGPEVTPETPRHYVNLSNAGLNPICHLLALAGAHHFVHVSGVRVRYRSREPWPGFDPRPDLVKFTLDNNALHRLSS